MNLFDATFTLACKVTDIVERTATGGTKASLEDSGAAFSAGDVGGTIWFTSGSNRGRSCIVTAQGGTSVTLGGFDDLAEELPYAVEAGDNYAYANGDFARADLRRAINEALRAHVPLRVENTTLTTVAEQEVYTLPDGVQQVQKVELAINDTAPYNFIEHHHWDEVDDELRFAPGYAPETDDRYLRLTYLGNHEDLLADGEDIPRNADSILLIWQAMVELARKGLRRFKGDDKRGLTNLMNESQQQTSWALGGTSKPQRAPRPADW